MMLIGYARVSTDDQKLDMQHDALIKAGCEKGSIFDDHMTGSKIERPGLKQALRILRSGDTLIIWRLDRLSRSLKDLIEMVTLLDKKNVGLKSLTECLDTITPSGKLIFHVFAALAEFERNVIRERTHAGLIAARARGKCGGRPKKIDAIKAELAQEMYDSKKYQIKQICELIGISKPTLYRYIIRDNEKN